jgi:hypothetical protein
VGNAVIGITVGRGSGSLPLSYTVNTELDPSDPKGCDIMTLEAWLGDVHSIGLLTDFSLPPTTTLGHIQFALAIPFPNDLPPSAECDGAIVFTAQVSGVPIAAFSDTKRYRFSILNGYIPPSAAELSSAPDDSDPTIPDRETFSGTSDQTNETTSATTSDDQVNDPSTSDPKIDDAPSADAATGTGTDTTVSSSVEKASDTPQIDSESEASSTEQNDETEGSPDGAKETEKNSSANAPTDDQTVEATPSDPGSNTEQNGQSGTDTASSSVESTQ